VNVGGDCAKALAPNLDDRVLGGAGADVGWDDFAGYGCGTADEAKAGDLKGEVKPKRLG
jgi:hypothetical protein